ncbi:hypothetical protein GCM10009765_35970 [Fodinicola feengrottensis]|uniref:DUF2244 domain-containing protein n=2 Tax=Fodinicola feengrottensis TaxID=435914 RepID=A0ABP4T7X0_9ACTN
MALKEPQLVTRGPFRTIVFKVRRGTGVELPSCCVRHGLPAVLREDITATYPAVRSEAMRRALFRQRDEGGFTYPVSIAGWPFCRRCVRRRTAVRRAVGYAFLVVWGALLALIGAYGYFGLGSVVAIGFALFAAVPVSAVLVIQLQRGNWELVAHIHSTHEGQRVEVRQPSDAFVEALDIRAG